MSRIGIGSGQSPVSTHRRTPSRSASNLDRCAASLMSISRSARSVPSPRYDLGPSPEPWHRPLTAMRCAAQWRYECSGGRAHERCRQVGTSARAGARRADHCLAGLPAEFACPVRRTGLRDDDARIRRRASPDILPSAQRVGSAACRVVPGLWFDGFAGEERRWCLDAAPAAIGPGPPPACGARHRLRHEIDPVRPERPASADSRDAHPAARPETVTLDRLIRVCGAGRPVPALAPDEARQCQLIEADRDMGRSTNDRVRSHVVTPPPCARRSGRARRPRHRR